MTRGLAHNIDDPAVALRFHRGQNGLYHRKEAENLVAQLALKNVERQTGKKFGDPSNPLLVSVRSGAKFSMPGMMDTILNLGLNDRAVEGLKARTRNGRFAFDSYRRFIQMFGNVVLEIPKDAFEHEFE